MVKLPIQRFLEKINVSDNIYQGTPCWDWTACKDKDGYGSFSVNGKSIRSHKFSYELYNGEIPKGLQLDHLCRNRDCINPIHLEPVTAQENIKRGLSGKINNYNKQKTHCPQGHKYNIQNTYRDLSRNNRHCIICTKTKQKKYQQRREKIRGRKRK